MTGLFSLAIFFVVGSHGTTAARAGPLVTTVGCIDYNDPQRKDPSWDYNKWSGGVEQWQNNGAKNVKICDEFIELAKDAGSCLYDDGLMCELNTTGINIGAAWIDTAGRFKGKVKVVIKNKGHFRWITTSETECHGHKFRVQFYGTTIPGKIITAALACGVARAHDSNSPVDNHHDACRFKTYVTPGA